MEPREDGMWERTEEARDMILDFGEEGDVNKIKAWQW